MKNKHVNQEVLSSFANGKQKLMLNIMSSLIVEMDYAQDTIKKAVANANWEMIRSIAHRLKPNMMLIGAISTKEIVQKIEQYANERRCLDEIPVLVAQFLNVIPEIINELKQESELVRKTLL